MPTTIKIKIKPVIRRDVELINDPITGTNKQRPTNKQKKLNSNGK